MHVGTLATIVDPGASNLFDWVKGLNTKWFLIPISGHQFCQTGFDIEMPLRNGANSDVVKMSDEDLEWLGYSDVNQILDFVQSYWL